MNNGSSLFLKTFLISFASSAIIGYLAYKLGNIDKSSSKKNGKKKGSNIDDRLKEKINKYSRAVQTLAIS